MDVDVGPTMCAVRCFCLSICLCISGLGQLCYHVFLDLGKANIGDLLALLTEKNISFNNLCNCTELESNLNG